MNHTTGHNSGKTKRQWAVLLRAFASVALTMAMVSATAAKASVSLLLEQPYGGMGTFNPTGHSAVYFDHICAATPVELRPCDPGELGVVISRYDGIGDFDWVAIPLVPYLYAVESSSDVPERADKLAVLRMRDLYRREYLESVAPDTETGGMPQGNWYELVGSAYDRTIYGFRVKTTPEQDAATIALFNDRPNVTRYEGAFRNCADFARVTINRFYPRAIRRNLIADFGMTTPKSVARGLTHYASKHPEAELEVFQVPQVEGDLPRSVGVQGVTESLLKRYGVPLVILSPQVTAGVLVAYLGQGRFAVPKHAPALNVPAMELAAENEKLREELITPAVLPNLPEEFGDDSGRRAPALGDGGASELIAPADCPECAAWSLIR